MKNWKLDVKVRLGDFSDTYTVKGKMFDGTAFSLFVPREFVTLTDWNRTELHLGNETEVEGRLAVEERTDKVNNTSALIFINLPASALIFIKLPAPAFEFGRDITVKRSQLYEEQGGSENHFKGHTVDEDLVSVPPDGPKKVEDDDPVEHSEHWIRRNLEKFKHPGVLEEAVELLELKAKVSKEFAAVINANNLESGSNTPDHILGEYLVDCLWAFDVAVMAYNGRENREKFETKLVELNPTLKRIEKIVAIHIGSENRYELIDALRKEFETQ